MDFITDRLKSILVSPILAIVCLGVWIVVGTVMFIGVGLVVILLTLMAIYVSFKYMLRSIIFGFKNTNEYYYLKWKETKDKDEEK